MADLPLAALYLNTALFALTTAFAQVCTGTAAAYAFARLRFAGRDRVFALLVALLTVPGITLVLPRYVMLAAWGWTDTYPGLISADLVSVWGIVMLREYFRTLPPDLEDAARVDGAGEWSIFVRVAAPLSKPAVAAFAVMALVEQWRSFLWPLVVMRSPERQVLEVGVAELHGLYAGNWPVQLAVAGATAVPLLLLYPVGLPWLVRGIQATLPARR